MIHFFSVENFASIRERVEVDFRSYDDNSLGDWAVTAASGTSLSLALGFFGANGSGKTNILKALLCCFHLMQNSFANPVIRDQSWFHQKGVSKFELVYESEDGEIFEYHLHLSSGEVVEERLISKTKKKDIFSRIWNEKKKTYIISSFEDGDPLKIIPFQSAKRSTSFISYSLQFSIEAIKIPISYCFNIDEMGRNALQNREAHTLNILYQNKELLKAVEKELSHIDTGLLKIKISQSKKSVQLPFGNIEHSQLQVEGWHSVEGKEYMLPYPLESGGTRVAVTHLAYILPALQTGGVAVVDEIEAELHPQLVEYLVRLFKDPERNKKKAQLVFSSHLHIFLNELEAERVYLVEKNDGGSEAYRLDEFEDLKEGDDLRRKYLAGAFGAVPNL